MDEEKRLRLLEMIFSQYERMADLTDEATKIKTDGRKVICKLTEILNIANDTFLQAIQWLDEKPTESPEKLN